MRIWPWHRRTRGVVVEWADARVVIRHHGWWLWEWTIYGYIPHHPEIFGNTGHAFTYDGALKAVGKILKTVSNGAKSDEDSSSRGRGPGWRLGDAAKSHRASRVQDNAADK